MPESIDLQFERLPSMPGLLARGAVVRKKPVSNPDFPRAEVRGHQVVADPTKVQQYSQVCGFDQSAGTLPLTYPHVLAFRLHMEMLLQKAFPITPMGLVHVRNDIIQHKAIPLAAAMDIRCNLHAHRLVDSGVEFDIRSEVSVDNELLWEDMSVFMARLPQKNAKRSRPKRPEMKNFANSEQWQLAGNLGRRYAAASGDYNPIHLYAPTARLLGFKRQIAHGMWSKARCVAAMQPQLGTDQCQVQVAFKTPIFLPATVALHYEAGESSIDFELRNETGKRPHLTGCISALDNNN